MGTEAREEDVQVALKFVTDLPPEFRVPETPVAVPGVVKRYGLSQIINHLLGLEIARPFDFLIDGELLRKSIQEHLADHSLSMESVIEVQYLPIVAPPKTKNQALHDDWVSALDGSWAGGVLSGSHDGIVRGWNGSLDSLWSLAAHSGPVTSVVSVPTNQGSFMLTSSRDGTIKLWEIAEGAGGPATLVATCKGDNGGVESVAVAPSGKRWISGGREGVPKMWASGKKVVEQPSDDQPGKKNAASDRRKDGGSATRKRKSGALDNGVDEEVVIEEPLARFTGHTQTVSSVAWPSEDTIVTAGWDHSVRRWDAETGANMDTFSGSKVVCDASPAPGGAGLIAFGGADPVLRTWDPRSRSGEAIAVRRHASHAGWIVSVKWSPYSQHHVVTGSYDHSLKLWDVRGAVPLGTVSSHSDKVLAVDWEGEGGMVSGGADCMVMAHACGGHLV
ncbi:unnamed protein product [Ostreobium quekettii]|uniref:Ribosome biogenesis protein WDR12 homolog n=1 Tax=Ostreobium quekettii TaxID=121088 RepID=A0A8S1JFW6_9CHLO|nr:unnamed protein product [Ostreobium quekettii]